MKLPSVVAVLHLFLFCSCYQSPLDRVNLVLTDEEVRAAEDTLHDVPSPDATIPHDVEPVAIRMLKPEYPSVALHGETVGNVALKVWVTTQGSVRRAVVLRSTNPVFNKAALRAAMGWYFSPGYENGNKVACWTTILMGFHTTRTQDIDLIR